MDHALRLPTLRDIRRGLAAGDAQNAFDNLSTLRPLGKAPITPAAVAALEATNKGACAMFEKAQALADRLNEHPMPTLPYELYRLFFETGDRSLYEHVYFEQYTSRGTANALAWLRTGEKNYLRQLENMLWALCDTYTWCLPAHVAVKDTDVPNEPAYDNSGRDLYLPHTWPNEQMVDLFASMHGQDVAQMLYILGDDLSPNVVRRLRQELRRRIFDPMMDFNQPQFWETCENNWGAVCAGSVGCAAIYSIRDSALLAPILTRMCQDMEGFLAGFDDDGICEEGLSYWCYGFRHFVMFAELLRLRTAGTIDLFQIEKVRRIACFPQKSMLVGLDTVSFSDCSTTMSFDPAMLHYLHHRVPEAALPADGCMVLKDRTDNWFSYCCMSIEHYDPALMGAPGFPDGSWYFKENEWLVCRKTVGAKAMGFAAKGGHNMVSHNHNDAGSFIVDVGGKQLLCDAGSGLYTRQYFNHDIRYTLLACGSHGHSVPIVDGHTQLAGTQYKAENTQAQSTDAADILTCDLACAYGWDGLHSLARCLRFDKATGTVTVEDSFALAAQPSSITERFTTWYQPVIQDGRVVIADGNDRLVLTANCPVTIHSETFAAHGGKPETDPQLWFIDYALPCTGTEIDFKLIVQLG